MNFEGVPVWHASVSFPDYEGKPIPVKRWTSRMRALAGKRLEKALKGCGRRGDDAAVMDAGEITLQVRVLMRDDEIKRLPQDKLPDSFDEHPAPRFGPYAQ